MQVNYRQSVSAVVVLLFCAGALFAQEPQQPVAPIAPIGQETAQPAQPATVLPDTTPVSGAHDFSLGVLEGGGNFLVPTFRVTAMADSNARLNNSNSSDFVNSEAISGSFAVQRQSARNTLTTTYTGTGLVSSVHTLHYHALGFDDGLTFGRWQLRLTDELNYSPESTFGLGSIGGFGLGGLSSMGSIGGSAGGIGGYGLQVPQLAPGISPGQSVLTNGARLSEMGLIEVQYAVSPRGSLTLDGAYGLLHFFDGDNIDSDQQYVGGGYSYELSERNSVGVNYARSMFHFAGSGEVDSDRIGLSYGRKIGGRMALRLVGGPAFSSRKGASAGPTHLTWHVQSSMQYQMGRVALDLTYTHQVSDGSGTFLGSNADTVHGQVSRTFGNFWSTSVTGGYSRNSQLQWSLSSNAGQTARATNGMFAGATVRRTLTQTAGMFLSYSLRRQTTTCTVVSCGLDLTRHIFGIGFDWKPRPISLN